MKTHNRRRLHQRSRQWPIDLWVPGHEWVDFSSMTPDWLVLSIERADSQGDLLDAVSRWQGGLAGAKMVGLEALVDYPPGPRDGLYGAFPIIAKFVGQGLAAPTHTFRTGQRVFITTEAGRDLLRLSRRG